MKFHPIKITLLYLILVCQVSQARCQLDTVALAEIKTISRAETFLIANFPNRTPVKEKYAQCVAEFQGEFIAYLKTLDTNNDADYQALEIIAMAARNFYRWAVAEERQFYAAVLSHTIIPLAVANNRVALEYASNGRKTKHLIRGSSFHHKNVQKVAVAAFESDLSE